MDGTVWTVYDAGRYPTGGCTMATTAPRTTDEKLGYRSQESELDIEDLPVRGEVPAWLGGSLVRTGPALYEVGTRTVNHLFDGQAMLHRFGFADGRVSYRNRFLQTQALRKVREDGRIGLSEFATDPCRSIFGSVMSKFTPPKLTDNGNVNVIPIGDEGLAMTETPLPVVFDPATLETAGVADWAKDIPGMHVSAHPHHDRERNELVSYATKLGPRCAYRVWTMNAGTGVHEPKTIADLPVRKPAYMHSFGLTERYVVLIDQPFVLDMKQLILSGRPFAENFNWEPERGTTFIVLDRASGEVVARVKAPAMFIFHVVNAWEEDGEVVLDACTYEDAEIVASLYLDRLRGPDARVPGAELQRHHIPLSGGAVRSEALAEPNLELARIDYGRRNGKPYRYVWGVSDRGTGPGNRTTATFGDQLAKIDVTDGSVRTWHEADCHPGEPVFVREAGREEEDAGVCLSVVLDARSGTSFLLVLDAAGFEEVARAEVPQHIPYGFHGSYMK
jgi:carotenoid cleavage dioxygenase-like enzyme